MIAVRTAGHDAEVCDCTRCRIRRMELTDRRRAADRRIEEFAVTVDKREGQRRGE